MQIFNTHNTTLENTSTLLAACIGYWGNTGHPMTGFAELFKIE